MKRLALLVPTRGRPNSIKAIIDDWYLTDYNVDLWLGIDDDDPEYDGYRKIDDYACEKNVEMVFWQGPRKRLGPTLNDMAICAAKAGEDRKSYEYDYISFLGDDHRPRTQNWNELIVNQLESMGTGIVYGDDLLQGANLPTAVFMTANIVRELGYMVPPGMIHLYLDDFWKDLGNAAGILKFMPNVIIEHMHPAIGKAEWTAQYQEVNSQTMFNNDAATYAQYKAEQFDKDVAKVRALCDKD